MNRLQAYRVTFSRIRLARVNVLMRSPSGKRCRNAFSSIATDHNDDYHIRIIKERELKAKLKKEKEEVSLNSYTLYF